MRGIAGESVEGRRGGIGGEKLERREERHWRRKTGVDEEESSAHGKARDEKVEASAEKGLR